MRLAVSGDQPLFTLGLPKFALSLQYFRLYYGAPVQTSFFLLMSKMSFEGQKQNIRKITCWLKTRSGFVGQILIKLETSSVWGFLQLSLWCPLGSNLCKYSGGQSVTSEACTSHYDGHSVTTEACTLTGRVCVVWRCGSSLDLSALCNGAAVEV